MSTPSTTYKSPDHEETEIKKLDELSGGGARIEVDVPDGPRWRLDVNATGKDYDLVTSWDETGQLADIEPPEWIDEMLLRLRNV